MKPIRILYINGGIMNRGGIESYMMNYYRHINRNKIQIDFVVHGYEKGAYDDEIESMGGKIYRVPIKSKNYIENIKKLKEIFLSGEYKIVHSHMDAMSMIVLKLAKKCGIPIRIAHSHNTQHLTNSKCKFILNEYARKNINKYATHLFACSDDAGKWLFGEAEFENKNVTIINNAIETDKFKFNEFKRNKLREELNVEKNFVIGHIGRFDYQKNHMFLLEIFKDVLEYKPSAKLVLVGDGHLRNIIQEKIKELNISDNVIILGIREDISDIINMFDLFILPSLFEGLPVVLVEAQTNGLPCIISNKVPKSVNLDNKVVFIDLEENSKEWAKQIINTNISYDERKKDYKSIFIKKGYDIINESKNLQDIYINLIEDFKN